MILIITIIYQKYFKISFKKSLHTLLFSEFRNNANLEAHQLHEFTLVKAAVQCSVVQALPSAFKNRCQTKVDEKKLKKLNKTEGTDSFSFVNPGFHTVSNLVMRSLIPGF
jgi:hypothetical protein